MAEETNRVIPRQALQQVAEAIPEDGMILNNRNSSPFIFIGLQKLLEIPILSNLMPD